MDNRKPRQRCVDRGPWIGLIVILAAVLLVGGCGSVHRTLVITSEPPGALVYLNSQEVGRTPLELPFNFYGWYDTAVRLEGYHTLKTETAVIAPWWQWVPFDFIAEMSPIKLEDKHAIHYRLTPYSKVGQSPAALIERANQLAAEADKGTPAPTTRPAAHRHARPHHPSTAPARR